MKMGVIFSNPKKNGVGIGKKWDLNFEYLKKKKGGLEDGSDEFIIEEMTRVSPRLHD